MRYIELYENITGETFIKGDKFTSANLAKANKVYGADMPNILKDVTRGINTSYVNQIAELFNIAGLFNLSDSNFLQANLLKKGLSRASLQVFQNSGEHYEKARLRGGRRARGAERGADPGAHRLDRYLPARARRVHQGAHPSARRSQP